MSDVSAGPISQNLKLKSGLSVETTNTGTINLGEMQLISEIKYIYIYILTFGFCSSANMKADHAAKKKLQGQS